MPTLNQAMAAMNPLFDDLVQARGRDVDFIDTAGKVRVSVRIVEAVNWTPTEYPAGEIVQQAFDIICRDNELVAAGIARAPRNPDIFIIDNRQRAVEAATPMTVGGVLFGWQVALEG